MSPSTNEIERDVEQTRAEVGETAEELRHGLTPGDFVNEANRLLRASGGSDLVRNLGRQVSENPLPLLLIGIGVAWLILSSSRAGQRRERYPDEAYLPGYGMSPEMIPELRAAVVTGNIAPAAISSEIAVGEELPSTVELHPIPVVVVEQFPDLQGHRLCVVDERIIIVDPNEPRVVDII